uniref:Protein krueppel n=1 Tax=Glossina palpalis gambiensis TaxID=67801 RepID=A0A1B0BE62_9MUSC
MTDISADIANEQNRRLKAELEAMKKELDEYRKPAVLDEADGGARKNDVVEKLSFRDKVVQMSFGEIHSNGMTIYNKEENKFEGCGYQHGTPQKKIEAEMIICGNILVDFKSNKFLLKCILCEKKSRLYRDFVKHIKNKHKHETSPLPQQKEEVKLECEQQQQQDEDELSTKGDVSVNMNADMDKHPLAEIEIKPPESELAQEEDSIDFIPIGIPMGMPEDSEDDIKDEVEDEQEFMPEDEEFIPDEMEFDTDDNDNDDEEQNEDESSDNLDVPAYTEKFIPTFFRKKRFLNDFIDLYKTQQCLWNINNPLFENEEARQQAKKAIVKGMQKFNVYMKDKNLHKALDKLHRLCAGIKQNFDDPNPKKIPSVAKEYYKRCEFLNELIERKKISKTDQMMKKALNFQHYDLATVNFIDCYANYPIFYDGRHEYHNSLEERQRSLEELASNLSSQYDISLNDDELLKAIDQFQAWFYRMGKRFKSKKTKPSKADEIYFQKCKIFMPDEPAKKGINCGYCDKIYLCVNTLRVHHYKDHQVGELPFKCEQCGRTFDQNSSLTVHIQRAHVGKVYQCEYCERRFAVKSDLNVHKRIHTAEKPHVCEHCGKSFRLRSQLGYHVTAIHTKIRAFKCTMCPKDFLKKRDLTDHVKTHFNIRDKICETCGKGFSNCHSLIRHRQIHSEIRKFACKLCDAKFKQFVGLNGHMKRTHNIVKKSSGSN